MHIAVSNETMLLVIKFRIGGSLKYLSHADTLRVFQRACIRAGIEIRHTQGFNPHPKMSLPLPRPVGVESEEELLVLQVSHGQDEVQIKAGLCEQLPEGIELVSVTIDEANKSFQPCSATYILKLQPQYLNGTLKPKIESLLTSKSLFVVRTLHHGTRGKITESKEVNVRPFLKSIELCGNDIIVKCNISSVGSIRVEEILKLLQLQTDMLAAPVRRTNIQWQKT